MALKVFITGASGQLGRELIKNLKNYFYTVGLYRRTSDSIETDQAVYGDLMNPETFLTELSTCDFVILNGALFRDSGARRDDYFRVNAESVKEILKFLNKTSKHRVKRIILVSTNAVHDLSKPDPISEDSPYGPHDFYQASKLLAERYFLEYLDSAQVEGVIVRPGMIWGNKDRRLKKIFQLASQKFIPLVGDYNPWAHFITFSDLAEAIRRLLICNGINREAFIIAGKRAIKLKSLFTIISLLMGKTPRFINLPKTLTLALCDVAEPLFLILGRKSPIFRRRIYFFLKDRIFNSSKYVSCCGNPFSSDLISEIYSNMLDYGFLDYHLEYEEFGSLSNFTYIREMNDVKLLKFKSGAIYALPRTWTYMNDNSVEMLRVSPTLGLARVNQSEV